MASARAALARQRAETAADLAALAGAQALAGLTAGPCGVAGLVAAGNGGRLVSCAIIGDAVAVSVSVTSPTSAVARARAGPQGSQ